MTYRHEGGEQELDCFPPFSPPDAPSPPPPPVSPSPVSPSPTSPPPPVSPSPISPPPSPLPPPAQPNCRWTSGATELADTNATGAFIEREDRCTVWSDYWTDEKRATGTGVSKRQRKLDCK